MDVRLPSSEAAALNTSTPWRPSRRGALALGAAVCAGVALWLSFGLLAVTDARLERRIGLLPSIGWLVASLSGSTVVVIAALRLTAGVILPALLPLFFALVVWLPWLPLPVPHVWLAFTGPSVGLVWAAIAMAMIAGGLMARRRSWPAWARHPRHAPCVAACLALVVFLAVHAGQRVPPSGDEPHYLVIAQSLIRDRDVRVANNYERRDYADYYRGLLQPHYLPAAGGATYSSHAPGLSALVAPAFVIGGYRAVVVWVAILVALGTAMVWKAGHVLTGDASAAWFGWAVVTLTVPGALLGSLVYPDAVAGPLFAAGALALVHANVGGPGVRWSPMASLGLGFVVGLLPWLHVRLALPAVLLATLLSIHWWHGRQTAATRRHWVAFGAPVFLCVIGWIAFVRLAYGMSNPLQPWGGAAVLDARRAAAGFLGLMADQEFGLVANAPVDLVLGVGLWAIVRQRPRLAIELLVLTVPYVMALSAYPIWWAGYSPPARFLMPVVFALGASAAASWSAEEARGRAFSLTLLAASVLVALTLASGADGTLPYNEATGRARWLDWVSPLADLPSAFPSVFRDPGIVTSGGTIVGPYLARPAIVWSVALVAAWWVFVRLDARLRLRHSGRVLLAPAIFIGASALATTVSWLVVGERSPATRTQLELLRRLDPRVRPIGVQLHPASARPPAEMASRLMIATSQLDPSPAPRTLLFLQDVPAGAYRVHVMRKADAGGELTLGIGHGHVPAGHWRLAHDSGDSFPLDLPLLVSTLALSGDEEAVRGIERVVLSPTVHGAAPPTTEAYARDAARYGSRMVYALDDRVWLESGGFWLMGAQQPEVLVTADDDAVRVLELHLQNGPVRNAVRLRAAAWSDGRTLTPDERWTVHVPVADPRRGVVVAFDVERAFRPVDWDRDSRDRRALGCFVQVE